jgi:hypothetical protein
MHGGSGVDKGEHGSILGEEHEEDETQKDKTYREEPEQFPSSEKDEELSV